MTSATKIKPLDPAVYERAADLLAAEKTAWCQSVSWDVRYKVEDLLAAPLSRNSIRPKPGAKPLAISYCMTGAIRAVLGIEYVKPNGKIFLSKRNSDELYDLEQRYLEPLAKAVDARGARPRTEYDDAYDDEPLLITPDPVDVVQNWNDAPPRTRAQVISALRRTAKKIREKQTKTT